MIHRDCGEIIETIMPVTVVCAYLFYKFNTLYLNVLAFLLIPLCLLRICKTFNVLEMDSLTKVEKLLTFIDETMATSATKDSITKLANLYLSHSQYIC